MRLLKCALGVGKVYPSSVRCEGWQETETPWRARHTGELIIHAVWRRWALGVEIFSSDSGFGHSCREETVSELGHAGWTGAGQADATSRQSGVPGRMQSRVRAGGEGARHVGGTGFPVPDWGLWGRERWGGGRMWTFFICLQVCCQPPPERNLLESRSYPLCTLSGLGSYLGHGRAQ